MSVTFRIKEEVVPSGKGGTSTGGSGPARDARLKAAQERRLKLDPAQLARERRIDVPPKRPQRRRTHHGTRPSRRWAAAEVAAAAAIERLIVEQLAVKDVVQLTGLDQATVRRLRQLESDGDEIGTSGGGSSRTVEGAGAAVA